MSKKLQVLENHFVKNGPIRIVGFLIVDSKTLVLNQKAGVTHLIAK